MCKIAATILVSDNAPIVADSLRSVRELVDAFIVVDTGSKDRTLDIVRRVVGKDLLLSEFTWQQDFSAARNHSLDFATQRGFDWALTVDTDERFQLHSSVSEIKEQLTESTMADAWLVRDLKHGYSKERFIRLPSRFRWHGRTHEYFEGNAASKRQLLKGIAFFEISKTSKELQKKLKRDLEVLLEETEINPLIARWWYFLGQTYEQLGHWQSAIDAFRRAIHLSRWQEEIVWAIFCSARCFIHLGQLVEAVRLCADGLRIQYRTPELAWLAAKCCVEQGNFNDAITWGEIAVQLGCTNNENDAPFVRINFHHLPAWYEAPFEVLRTAYTMVGRIDDRDKAIAQYQRALTNRLLQRTGQLQSQTNE